MLFLEAEDRRIWQNPEAILNDVKVLPNFIVADLGCGSGYFTVALSRMAKKVYAIDIQKEMLSFLEDKIRRLKIKNVELVLSKPDEIPLENESVDFLMSINTLHEFGDKDKVIKEMRRVIKRGCNLLIADFKKEKMSFGPPVRIRVAEDKAIKLFEERGFVLSKADNLQYHYLLVFTKD